MIRRTPLKRSTKPIRRVSKKRAKEMRSYAQKRKAFLDMHPICQVWLKESGATETPSAMCCLLLHGVGPRATEIHHREGRGRNYLNEETWLAVCRQNHERIHNNPSWARANGFLV